MLNKNERDVAKVQSYIRIFLCKRKFKRKLCERYDALVLDNKLDIAQNLYTIKLLFNYGMFDLNQDVERFCSLLKLVAKLDTTKKGERFKYFLAERRFTFLELFKRFLEIGNTYLIDEKFESKFQTIIALYLNFIIFILNMPSQQKLYDDQNALNDISSKLLTFMVDLNIYKILYSLLYKKFALQKTLSKVIENAAIFVALKIIQSSDYSKDIIKLFVNSMLIIPQLIHHLIQNPFYITNKSTMENKFFDYLLNDISNCIDEHDGNLTLIIFSNICYYIFINQHVIETNLQKICTLLSNFLVKMKEFILVDQKQAIHWHSIYGWASIPSPSNEIIDKINSDIKYLWSPHVIAKLIIIPRQANGNQVILSSENKRFKNSLNVVKNLPQKILHKKSNDFSELNNLLTHDGYLNLVYSTTTYELLMDSFLQQKLNILSSLSCKYDTIEFLWNYLLGSGDLDKTIHMYVEILRHKQNKTLQCDTPLKIDPKMYAYMLNPLIFTCDITSHVIIILDDEEIFNDKVLFHQPTEMLIRISKFLNKLIYKIIWDLGELECNSIATSPIDSPKKILKMQNFVNFFDKFHFSESTTDIIGMDNVGKLEIFTNPFFTSCHTLLKILYERDNKNSFTPPGHWLIKEVKLGDFFDVSTYEINNFLDMEIEHSTFQCGNLIVNIGKRINYDPKEIDANLINVTKQDVLLNKIPHILSQTDRITLFRKYLAQESGDYKMDDTVNYIKIRRIALLEDGFAQISLLSPAEVKGTIRVRFVNPQGLEEPGIDQDGVFKEFLEEIVQKIFNPALNLFKITSDQKYYPSPTSYLQDNSLNLFEFVGRLVGKAIFEGLVLDGIELAPFFLNQIVHPTASQLTGSAGSNSSTTTSTKATQVCATLLLYSPIDELESMDAELYKNLKYLKKCGEGVEELALTFAASTDCMGTLLTEDLIPGGRSVAVTCENRFSYIHLMARHRMHVQIHKQLSAFLRGFYAIIRPEPISIFSGREFQQIISGDTREIDITELRKHTKYYGGFFDKHRVVVWLWDILAKDFDATDRSKFLKFVTSCSRPPLLGFAQLEPPFSIRCVDVGEEQDTGDTIATVIQGFFSLRRLGPKDKKGGARLPTASTCFNLLKLPNYSKKSVLKEKLLYAIHSNTGFELS